MKKLLIATALFCSFSALAQDDASDFTMDGEFGLNFTTGNTETTSMSAGLNIKHELERWSNEYLIEGLYKKEKTLDTVSGEEIDRTSAQRFFGSAQGNYKLDNPDHRVFVFSSYEDNRLSNFKYQATVAAGWNQKVWEDDKSSFDYSIGPGYAFAKTQEDESANSVIVRGAFNYTYLISETAKFTQTFSTEIGSDNTKSRAESALTATISGALSMKLSVQLDHNSDVAPGLDNLDTETAVTLVYSFF